MHLLSPQPGDAILDIGCGDAVLTFKIAAAVAPGGGRVVGLDSSASFIRTAREAARGKRLEGCTDFELVDCRVLNPTVVTEAAEDGGDGVRTAHVRTLLQPHSYDKIFSNAAMHWILRSASTRTSFFSDTFHLLKPGGTFAFEMGGHGNINEIHAALVAVLHLSYGIPIAKIQEANPWFFASEPWMREVLQGAGFEVLVCESEERPTKVTEGEGGGLEGWVRVMCGAFLELVEEAQKEGCIEKVVQVLGDVCAREDGGVWLGYVRLRALARRPL